MKTISFINIKGGVGKTTTALNVACGLVKLKKKVLLIDLDFEAHLTYCLGYTSKASLYDIINNDARLQDIIIETHGLDLIPASINLNYINSNYSKFSKPDFLVYEALSKAGKYDYCIIDVPPGHNAILNNVLAVTDRVFIPCQAEVMSLKAVYQFLPLLKQAKKHLNKKLQFKGLVVTMYDNRKGLSKEIVKEMRKNFKGQLVKPFIRQNVALTEAQSYKKSIFDYSPKSNGAADYMKLTKSIIKKR
jgi:chromosome partitioning protein